MKAHYWETRQSMTPLKALQFLKEGNKRFTNNLSTNRNTLQLLNETKDQQFPFAAVLSCSDSRVPVELVFDQGIGDVFSVRLAGNIATVYATASLEYACKYLGSKLILVMGHTGCGAVKGACDDLDDGNIHNILSLIKPAVEAEKEIAKDRTSANKKFTDKVTTLNVVQQIYSILSQSDMLSNMIRKADVIIAGAVYNVEDGGVIFLEEFNSTINQYEKLEVYEG